MDINQFNDLLDKAVKAGVPKEYAAQKILASATAQQQTTQQPKTNFLASMAKSLIQPAANYLAPVGESIMAGLSKATNTPYTQPYFMTEKQLGAYEKPSTAILPTMKNIAGMEAYFLPGGGGTATSALGRIGSAAAKGALSGGAFGFASSPQDTLLESVLSPETLKGAAVGGAAGGVLQGAGELVKAIKPKIGSTLKEAGYGMQKNVMRPNVKASPTGATKEIDALNAMQEMGLKGSPEHMYQMMPTAYNKLSEQIDDLAKGMPIGKTKSEILKLAKEATDNTINFDENAQTRVLEQLKNTLTGKVDTSNLLNYKLSLGDQLKRAFAKEGSASPLTPAEETMMSLWEAIDGMLPASINKMTRLQSALYKVAPGIEKAAKEGVKVPIPVVGGQKIPLVSGQIQAGEVGVGRGLVKLGEKMTGGGDLQTLLNKYANSNISKEEAIQLLQSKPFQQAINTFTKASTQTPNAGKYLEQAINKVYQTGDQSTLRGVISMLSSSLPKTSSTAIKNATILADRAGGAKGLTNEALQKLSTQLPATLKEQLLGQLPKAAALMSQPQQTPQGSEGQVLGASTSALPETPQNVNMGTDTGGGIFGGSTTATNTGATGMPDKAKFARAMLMYPKHATVIKQIYDMLSTGAGSTSGRKLSTTETAAIMASSTGTSMVNQLSNMYDVLNQKGLTATGPFLGQISGALGKAASATRTSPEARTFEDMRKSTLSLIVRALGEVGTLNEGDINRVQNAIPTLYDDPATKELKIQTLKNFINGRMAGIQAVQNYGTTVPETP